jgi:DNA-binding NarL/FixJ family response regulator
MGDHRPLAVTVDFQSIPTAQEGGAVAIVVPPWLQDGLAVVIKAIPRTRLVACTGSVQSLLLIDLERAPNVIVLSLDGPESKANNQIRQARFVYPKSRYLVLVAEQVQSVGARAAGADETLLQGASAEQVCAAVSRLLGGDQVG